MEREYLNYVSYLNLNSRYLVWFHLKNLEYFSQSFVRIYFVEHDITVIWQMNKPSRLFLINYYQLLLY